MKTFVGVPLYASNVVRTLFLDFQNADWEKELEDFHGTDVEVPARLTVDGKSYSEVGIHFRGASSFFTVGEGRKRSLNLSLDFAHDKQDLDGYRTLNLLNSHAMAIGRRPCGSLGCSGSFYKPFQNEELLSALHQALHPELQ